MKQEPLQGLKRFSIIIREGHMKTRRASLSKFNALIKVACTTPKGKG